MGHPMFTYDPEMGDDHPRVLPGPPRARPDPARLRRHRRRTPPRPSRASSPRARQRPQLGPRPVRDAPRDGHRLHRQPAVPRLHPERPDQGVAALRHGRLVLLAQRHELHGVGRASSSRRTSCSPSSRSAPGMPATSGGTFVSGGSLGNLSALAVARDDGRRRHPDADPRHLRCAISEEAHSSVGAALHLLGMDPFVVPTDGPRADRRRAARRARRRRRPRVRSSPSWRRRGRPTPASSTTSRASASSRGSAACGSTSTPPTAGRRCSGASRRDLFGGLRHADSFIVDPHKWLFAPLDCCALIYREPAARAHDAHPARELPRRPARRRRRGRGRVEPLRLRRPPVAPRARAARCGSRSPCTAPTCTPTRSTARSPTPRRPPSSSARWTTSSCAASPSCRSCSSGARAGSPTTTSAGRASCSPTRSRS